jgi:hypothetical protein
LKKFLRLVSATVVTMAVGFVPAASAATCTISNTGPSSTNSCTVSDTHTVTITCTNGVGVTNATSQSAVSGSVNVTGNTISGTATSGDANNVNTVATELALNCAAAPATTPTATTPTTPAAATPASPAGGQGAVQGASAVKVAALPQTGPSTLPTTIAVSAVAMGSVSALAHVALGSYRRRAFKA